MTATADTASPGATETFETKIPARLDRLPWSRWHWLVVFALGTVWILDGLEVTIVGSIGAILKEQATLGLSSGQIGLLGSVYVAGAVTGALGFGYLTDRLGRKRLFFVTLAVYTAATAASAFAWDFWSFFAFRFVTGMGIGGEYAAINSAIDELIPARVRGWVDLAINGSFWLGTVGGASVSLLLLDEGLIPVEYGWRVAFATGAVLAAIILVTRRLLPESPRWLMIHGRGEEAEKIVGSIEERVQRETGEELDEPEQSIEIEPREHTSFVEIARTMFKDYPSRTLLAFSLMAAQAFFYNAVFFTYAIILSDFFDVKPGHVPLYLIPFALGNFLGPLLVGRLFDVVGRRTMIAASYIVSGIGMAVIAWFFSRGSFGPTSLTIAYSIVFFIASSGASSAYLTVSEIFPLEIRAMAIAFFYAIATGAGGIAGPAIYGALVGTGDEGVLALGFVAAAALMAGAGVIEAVIGVPAEQESLEDVAEPLSANGDGGADGSRPQEAAKPAEPAEPAKTPARQRPAGQRTFWSAYPLLAGVPADDTLLERELARIEQALASGPLDRRALARAVRARAWGPGRFRRALRRAVEEQRVRAERGRFRVAGEPSS
jgi:MFS family permease